MKVKYFIIICFVFALLLISCEFFDHTYKYKPIKNAEVDIIVNHVETKNGFIINNEYYLGDGTILHNKNNEFPQWLFQKEEMKDSSSVAFYDDEGRLLTVVGKIRPPYRIFKKADSNIMYLIKKNDTLKFIAF
jgi:hypothetical protein